MALRAKQRHHLLALLFVRHAATRGTGVVAHMLRVAGPGYHGGGPQASGHQGPGPDGRGYDGFRYDSPRYDGSGYDGFSGGDPGPGRPGEGGMVDSDLFSMGPASGDPVARDPRDPLGGGPGQAGTACGGLVSPGPGPGAMHPGPVYPGPVNGGPMTDGEWQSQRAAQTLTHFPEDELAMMSRYYAWRSDFKDWGAREAEAWTELSVLRDPPQGLGPSDLMRLRADLASVRRYDGLTSGLNLRKDRLIRCDGLSRRPTETDWISPGHTGRRPGGAHHEQLTMRTADR